MGNMIDYSYHAVRSAAILTSGYVAGTIIEDVSDHNQLVLDIAFTIGSLTTGEVKIEFANNKLLTLPYDNQTANFAVGELVTGASSQAFGRITVDTDGGTSGTLTLTDVRGTFVDNEALTGSLGGAARSNGGSSDASTWIQETASSVSAGVDTVSLLSHKFAGTGNYRLLFPIKDRRIKISAIGNGTATSSSMTINAKTGRV